MKKHLSFILLAALALTLLLPFNKPQTVQADDPIFGVTVNNHYVVTVKDAPRSFPQPAPVTSYAFKWYTPFHDTKNLYSDTGKFGLVSKDSSIIYPENLKVNGPYGSGTLKLFTVEYTTRPLKEGKTAFDLTYNGKVISENFAKVQVRSNVDTWDGETCIPMFRIYNPNSGEHFYTSSDKEKANLVSLGWNDEGTGWRAPYVTENMTVNYPPVYRLYNPNGSEHHYTTSEKEKNALVAAGWKYEGIGWYSFGKDDGIEWHCPVYRLYNPNAFSNNHHYTTSKKERDILIALGWKNEGIGWYGIGDHRGIEWDHEE